MHATLTLELPTSTVLQVTPEQFEALAAANRDLRLERTAKGELMVMPPAGGEFSQNNSSLTGQLYAWFETRDNLGVVFDSSGGFILPNGAIRSPDAAWVSRSRWDALTSEQRRGFPPLCPDFVTELRSGSDRPPITCRRYKLRCRNIATTARDWVGSSTPNSNRWKSTVTEEKSKC